MKDLDLIKQLFLTVVQITSYVYRLLFLLN